ncbi:MAG: tRNA cyclic N6-threonylcarbamoyladenosine(37) synthase TcdA [Candidatus Polarisedimenticolaceae bacterium]|nr:tRNA cyclic N6-threonylcarbamoyladenosine(37) synthase TcdA [Candidatus Polarisedimenticolaceae bacterium]
MSEQNPENDTYDERFASLGRLYGAAAMPILQQMHVCVVGLGGVGSWAVEALARNGVGAITLIDFDEVSLSNINRQLPALTETVGEKKWAVLQQRIVSINPACRVTIVDDFVTDRNVRQLLSPECGFDYVIDAIDSIMFKAEIIHQCRRNKIAVITIGGAGGVTDPTQIEIADLVRVTNDPLAAKVRHRLRSHHDFSQNPRRTFRIECVFTREQKRYPKDDGTIGYQKPGIHGVSLDCRFGYGSAAYVTASFGFAAAARVVNRTLKRKLAK